MEGVGVGRKSGTRSVKYLFVSLYMYIFKVILFALPFLTQAQIGLGLGIGPNGGSFSLSSIRPNDTVFHIGANIFNGRNEKNTYDFNPNLYDDADKGKLKEMAWITYGFIKRVENNAFSISLGLSFVNEYYKKHDNSEILSDDGNYYVTDDKNKTMAPTILFGSYFDISKNIYEKKLLGITLNLIPIDIGIIYYF
jgi:hypothetical protein|tara:strand:- start:408 stop:992 length:585 start_codon:yes stop_codon:yes gene_type:complete